MFHATERLYGMGTKNRKNTAIIATFACLLLAGATGCAGQERTPLTMTTTNANAGRADADWDRALVTRYFDDVWGKKNPDAVLGFASPDLVNHAAVPDAQGAEGLRMISRKIIAAFPDVTVKIDQIVASAIMSLPA